MHEAGSKEEDGLLIVISISRGTNIFLILRHIVI